MRERQCRKCPDLFKLTDKADGRFRARPSGLSERLDLCVNDFRRTTSMPVISMPSGYVVLISDLSESQYPEGMLRRKGLVRRFLSTGSNVYIKRRQGLGGTYRHVAVIKDRPSWALPHRQKFSKADTDLGFRVGQLSAISRPRSYRNLRVSCSPLIDISKQIAFACFHPIVHLSVKSNITLRTKIIFERCRELFLRSILYWPAV